MDSFGWLIDFQKGAENYFSVAMTVINPDEPLK